MDAENRPSGTAIEDGTGEPHVRQQQETVSTTEVTDVSASTQPMPQHRPVKLTDVVELW